VKKSRLIPMQLASAFVLAAALGACTSAVESGTPIVAPSATAVPSGTSNAAAPVGPSYSPSALPSAIPPAATSSSLASVPSLPPTANPNFRQPTWVAGGPTGIAGDIIATPGGYLATCLRDDGDPAGVCSSKDLVAWKVPPDPKLFVGGANFFPYQSVPVKSGYGAESYDPNQQQPPISDAPDSGVRWYSADGVHWQEGIPSAQLLPPAPQPCVPVQGADPGCANLDFVVSNPKSAVSLAGVDVDVTNSQGNFIYTHVLVSKDHWATWKEVTLPGDLWQLQGDPELLPDGTWLAACTVMPPPPPDGVVYGGDPEAIFIASKDGVHWTKTQDDIAPVFFVVMGARIFASDGGYEGGGPIMESPDGGKTWLAMQDPSGNEVSGEYLEVVGGKIVVFEGIDSDPGAILWVGTP
jgi:hypothetical protein